MNLDFAPMEGITGATFRRLHHGYFPGVDRYYTPFLSPTKEHRLTPRELREFLPENNGAAFVVPQILTKVPEDFLWAAEELHAMGYGEVNLNLGCPSGTVTAKGKGCGMLAHGDVLRYFLDRIFENAPCPISVKTRLGMEDPGEFEAVLEIYNAYPMTELIIHPRVRKDFYRHPVRTEAFDRALANSRNPVSYNGSINTPGEFAACVEKYPQLRSVMIGQGMVSDPFLAGRIRSGAASDRARLRSFHDELLETYARQFESKLNAAKRMKDLWFYLIRLFADSERHGKQILKSKTWEDYQLAVSAVFRDLPLLEQTTAGW
jgi:tRNA-dihydrouridine synthase